MPTLAKTTIVSMHVEEVYVYYNVTIESIINISSSNLLSVSLRLSGQNTFPAILKSLSMGADEADRQKLRC